MQLLKIIGCSKVIAIDPRPEAREKALEIGADFAFDPADEELKKHRGLNAAFDFAGVTAVRKQALSMLGEQGRLVIVGIANEPITIPMTWHLHICAPRFLVIMDQRLITPKS